MTKSLIRIVALAVFLFGAVNVHAQDADDTTVSGQSRFTLHPELFLDLGHSYVDRTPDEDGHMPGTFTIAYGVQFGLGTKKWVTCNPHSDPECTEKNGPRLAIGGLMLAWTPNTDLGLGLQFPLMTVRIVRNAWLGTAVTTYPWAPDGRRNTAFTIGLSICTSPDDGL